MANISTHQFFVLAGFDELGSLRPFLFLPFSILLGVALSANALLVYVVASHRSLHHPMCLLMAGMACVDFLVPIFFVPNMLLNFLFGWKGISLIGCLVQMELVHLFGAFQSTFLLWMALDRYFALCQPLHYQATMSPRSFLRFALPPVIRNVLAISQVVVLAGTHRYCSNVIHHCYCEHMALVELSCDSTASSNIAGLLAVFSIPVVDFLLIAASYVLIFSSVLRPGKSGVKALHTCFSHIMVHTFSVVVALVSFLSYRIRNNLPETARIFFSIMYMLLPCCVNPIVYGVRTTDIRQHMLRTLRRWAGGGK